MAYPVMSTSVPWSLVKSGFKKTPHFNSSTQKPAAGRGRSSISFMPYATWDFGLDLNYVLGGESVQFSVLQMFLGCFMACNGGGGFFLFTDPNDNAVDDPTQSLMLNVTPGASPMATVGDGASTQFQLARSIDQGVDILQNVALTQLLENGGLPLQNFYQFSQQFDNAIWIKSTGTTVTANDIAAPDGTITADLVSTTAGQNGYVLQIVPTTDGNTYTRSLYVKPSSGNGIVIFENVGLSIVSFDLIAGTCTGPGTSILNVGGGWFRCVQTLTQLPGTFPAAVYFGTYGPSATAQQNWVWQGQLESRNSANATALTTATPIDGGFSVSSTGVVTFNTAPPLGATLQWIGSFQYLCQFTDDTLKDLARVSKNRNGFLWSCSSIAFESVFV